MKNLILICCMGSFYLIHAQTDSLKQADNSTIMAKTLDKTDQALAKAIEKGMEVASKTGEFVVSQAPDLVKQFYVWSLVRNSIWIMSDNIWFETT